MAGKATREARWVDPVRRSLRDELATHEGEVAALQLALGYLDALAKGSRPLGMRVVKAKRKTRTMDAAQKRAVSVRMTRYWAKRRALAAAKKR